MNLMRIIILAAAIAAAGLTAILVRSLVSAPEVAEDKPVIPVNQVLVAARKIEVGAKLTEADLRWQEFPEPSIAPVYFTQNRNPEAIKELAGGIARAEIFAASPITPGKIVNAGEGGFMSAILEGGMRAMAVKIAPETGAGGFILPGDRVDVLLTRQATVQDENGQNTQETVSEIILENVRALAIDQTVNDPGAAEAGDSKSASSVIGKTATLQVTPAQAQTLALANDSGTLSLALRSLERKEDPVFAAREAAAAKALEEERKKHGAFTIIRYGTPGQFRPK